MRPGSGWGLRELVVQFFDCSGHLDSLKRIVSVRVEVLSPDPSRPPRLAIWLAAWLAGQLGWNPEGSPQNVGTSQTESEFKSLFEVENRVVGVEISTRSHPAPARLMGVTITADGGHGVETFRLARPTPESQSVRVEAEAADSCYLPAVVEAAELEPGARIAAALESSRSDPPFQKARPIALWLLSQC